MAPVRDRFSVVLTGAFIVLFHGDENVDGTDPRFYSVYSFLSQGDDLGEGVRSVKHEYGNGCTGHTYEHGLRPANRQAGEGGLE